MRILSIILCVALVSWPTTTMGQETPPDAAAEFRLPEPGEILPLRRGATAPRDGLLIDAGDLLQIQQEYERMRFLLERTTERDRETCDVRVEMERARTSACEERLRLRDELWTARQAELAAAVAEAREAARNAAERAWFESPILWFVVGVAVTAIVWIAATVR
jgi:multidrug resistance efflux pump